MHWLITTVGSTESEPFLTVRSVLAVSAVREVFHEVRKRRVSLERFVCLNTVSVMISTVSVK